MPASDSQRISDCLVCLCNCFHYYYDHIIFVVCILLLRMLVQRWSGRVELELRLISYDRIMPLACTGGLHESLTSTV